MFFFNKRKKRDERKNKPGLLIYAARFHPKETAVHLTRRMYGVLYDSLVFEEFTKLACVARRGDGGDGGRSARRLDDVRALLPSGPRPLIGAVWSIGPFHRSCHRSIRPFIRPLTHSLTHSCIRSRRLRGARLNLAYNTCTRALGAVMH